MNIFLVTSHPERHSLNGSLSEFTVNYLQQAGHQVKVSDLYSMGWKAQLDANDSPAKTTPTPYSPTVDSRAAFDDDTQPADIKAEQDKIRWADIVILQFPLWWFSMPAILKGWVDRVYSNGFAYGVGEHSAQHWGDRYGEGKLQGKRAMCLVTIGGWEPHYSARGVNGPIEDILFPINHGVLFYPGFDVLPPFMVYHTTRIDDARYQHICAELAGRLDTLHTIAPIPYRRQNGGDYLIPQLTLKPALHPAEGGFSIHRTDRHSE